MRDDLLGDELTLHGRTGRIETVGRRSGRPASATIGFVERDDGSLAVAAGSSRADWARNLIANPRCRFTIGPVTRHCIAELLEGPEHAAAVRELILKYGTPAERLGAGPAFVLLPVLDDGRAR